MRVLVLVLCLGGCGAPGNIYRAHQTQLAQIEIGKTTTAEFQTIMPRAYLSGQSRQADGSVVTAYEATHRYNAIDGTGWHNDTLWFYFYDDRIVKWGKPGDWPTPADLVVEVRNRP